MPKLPGLKRLRELAALSQQDLATKAGIDRVTLWLIERGRNARPSTVRKLADALNCTPAELMGEQPG